MLTPGDQAPNFALRAHDEGEVKLSDFGGRKVLVYSYPGR
ncbi:MAG: redoxin domain-containing protein [Acidimicrobiales bacterium]